MKLGLHHIEQGVRKQFTWISDPRTRWAVNPIFNRGVKGIGATVFIGLALQFGFPLQDIYDYIDLEEADVNEKIKSFNRRMNEMMTRKLTGTDLNKDDVTRHLYTKTKLSLSWIRLHCMKEYVPTYTLNH